MYQFLQCQLKTKRHLFTNLHEQNGRIFSTSSEASEAKRDWSGRVRIRSSCRRHHRQRLAAVVAVAVVVVVGKTSKWRTSSRWQKTGNLWRKSKHRNKDLENKKLKVYLLKEVYHQSLSRLYVKPSE